MRRFELSRLGRLRRDRGGASKLRLPAFMLLGGLVACACFLSTAAARTAACDVAGGACVLNVSVSTGGTVTDGGQITCPGNCSGTYDFGSPVTLTETPASGYTFGGWGGDCAGSKSKCVLKMDSDKSVTATFAPLTRNLSVSVSGDGRVTGPGINCTGTCQQTYQQGTQLTLTETPGSGATFTGWGGDCSGAGANSTCSLTMDVDRSVTASFASAGETLSVSVDGNGTVTDGGINCPGTCQHTYKKGAQVTLTETPAGGTSFTGWGGACSGAGTSTQCSLTMDANKNVTATFGGNPTLTVQKAGTGTGTVTSSPAGISCGGTCTAQFALGAQVTVTAAPDPGTSFAGWSGDCSGSGTTCTLTMNAVKTVTATFGRSLPMLTVHTTGSGQGSVSSSPPGIACGATCTASFSSGQKVVLTAAASSKFFFAGWKGACAGTSPTCSLTMTGDRDTTADFEPVPAIGDAQTPQLPPKYPPPASSLSVNVSGNGSVTSEASRGLATRGRTAAGAPPINCGLAGFQCYTAVKPGSVVTLLAKPGPGYKFQGWSGPCTVQGAACQVGLAAARTVSARFAPKVRSSTFAAGLTKPQFKIRWRASVGRGTIKVAGAVGKPALARVQLRRPRGGPLLTETVTVAAGRFVLLPKLWPGLISGGAHLFPGGFMVSLTGTSGRLKMPLQVQTVTLAAPPEGVVRTAYLSAAQGSRPVRSVAANQRQAYANFVLQTQPARRAKLSVRWYWPNGKLLGSIKKSNRPTIVSFLKSGTPLPTGNWTAELRAGNKLVQRLLVRIR